MDQAQEGRSVWPAKELGPDQVRSTEDALRTKSGTLAGRGACYRVTVCRTGPPRHVDPTDHSRRTDGRTGPASRPKWLFCYWDVNFKAKMVSFSGLGIGLSLVFGCLLLAIIAELYYVLWWKKRLTDRREIEVDYSNYVKELVQLFCWKKPSSNLQINNTQNCDRQPAVSINGHEVLPDLELGTTTTTSNKDLYLKAFGDDSEVAELMRLHNLAGPPRFLFTIKEETKEDLESDDGKSRCDNRSRKGSRTGSLSDFITPLASPTIKSSPLAAYHNRGFNPLFESSSASSASSASLEEDNLNKVRSSPPPKFKFLRDAEEKLFRKLMEEAEKNRVVLVPIEDCSSVKSLNTTASTTLAPEVVREGSFLKFIVGHQYHSSSYSQRKPKTCFFFNCNKPETIHFVTCPSLSTLLLKSPDPLKY
ncbi:hypothetical protein LWI29_009353 [Acer saccharum]|uniref:Uncharacterized protein n=1 Tax=Acer saccharum TaxID=4024 RepID=A0AA39W5U7_ACESA|nr:hypothetical protein LWI29_009353 [Acer saccharum]